MSALTHPRADLSGGNASDDSFAMSRRILTPLVTLCAFPGIVRVLNPGIIEHAHSNLKALERR